MKKVLPILVLGGVAVFLLFSGGDDSANTTQVAKTSGTTTIAKQEPSKSMAATSSTSGSASVIEDAQQDLDAPEIEIIEEDIRPATEAYSSADEALAALQAGAKEYDDLILEQFVEPDSACSWCGEFYTRVNELMLTDSISDDERSYYAEVLAISGRVDNVSTLVNAIAESGDENKKDLYAEALEMTVGDDSIVQFFSEKVNTEDELLKESILAAVTNHGSRLAIDVLYQETVRNDDPDGYYSIGIGLGEIIPDDDTLPYLQELANKRDKFSHLAVKALLNQGDQGLRMVMDMLEKSNDAETDRQLIEDAIDHVAYEDSTAEYLRSLSQSAKSEVAREFSKEALEEIETLEDEELDIELDEDTP